VALILADTLGVRPEQGETFRQALATAVERNRAARPSPPQQVTAALAEESRDAARDTAAGKPAGDTAGKPTRDPTAQTQPCRQSDTCLARAARRVPSELVLSLTVAGLGDMWLVRSRLLRASDGMAVQDVRDTVEGGARAVEQYAPRLARRLFPDSGRRPWYKQWWLWSSVAVGAAATAGLATWAAVRSRPEDTGVVPVGSLP
jgi:hypothetical protein